MQNSTWRKGKFPWFFNQIPVYRGSKLPLINRKFISAAYVHGTDGLGDVFSPDDIPPQAPLKQEHAVDALIRLAEEHKGLKGAVHVSTYGMFLIVYTVSRYAYFSGVLEVVCLAPLTNIALAIRMNENFSRNLKHCYIMGGNYKGKKMS